MGTPKENIEKINAVTSAWETLRPAKTFAGMTLVQFKAKVKPSTDARTELATAESQIVAAQNHRDDSDKTSIAAIQLVVNAVKGDPEEGEDGELYEALGYRSARSNIVGESEWSAGCRAGFTASCICSRAGNCSC